MEIELLKLCVEQNPFECGDENGIWKNIFDAMKLKFPVDFSLLTLQRKMMRLLDLYKKEELKWK